ncbi:MAG: hypothetical protein GX187_07550 [Clostridiaceae bacterium]|nr:hypothetical protein [Clostridiaceae bacterium]
MNKINMMFKKDSVIKIISVFIAVFIWFLVLDLENPFEERSLSVPLISNIEVLRTHNLQLIGSQIPASVDIKIRGRRDNITAVTANDFYVNIDLSEVTSSGTKTIKVNPPKYLGDKDIMITSINPSSVVLTFERIVGKQYPVNVEFVGKLPAGYELVNFSVDPGNVILEELESSIEKVEKVVAYVNLDEIGDNSEIIMRGTAIDTNGEVVRQFEGKIPVIVRFNLAKRLPVVATTRGEPAEDFYLKEIRYSIPEIRALGTRKVLDSLTKIEAEAIDISGKSASFTTPLSLILPEGVTVFNADAEKLSAEVVIDQYVTKNINISASQITIYDGDMTGSKIYKVSDEPITIAIKGRPELVNAVRPSDISVSVQVGGFEKGEHEVPLNIKLPSNITLVGEYTVNIVIEEEPVTTPVPENP